jgi:SAM-dependent methyltransferase
MALDSGSVDLITAAQAFHWFDIARARTEFLRVLKPTGQVALVWNDRVLHDPLHLALDEVFARFGGVKRGALLAHEERMEVPAFFGSATSVEHGWPHVHHLDAQGLRSLVFSRSYMPAQGSEAARQATVLVDALFERFAVGAQVAVPYTTLAIVGRPG